MSPSPRICLSMIVRDEAPVVERCLRSCLPWVHAYAVVDTGSTDATKEIMARVLADLPGSVADEPWTDFATARNAALDLARASDCDYALVIDADDVLVVPPGFSWGELDADAYAVEVRGGGVSWRLPRLLCVDSDLPSDYYWRWRGVLHEYPEWQHYGHDPDLLDSRPDVQPFPLTYVRGDDGARRRDPETYARDVTTLRVARAVEPDADLRRRYTFYLAQSCRDAGRPAEALEAYLDRAALGGWDQEVYVSLLSAARLVRQLGQDPELALTLLLRASALCPRRFEAEHATAVICRELVRWVDAYGAAAVAYDRSRTPDPDALFTETWVTDYGAQDELAVAAYWIGSHGRARDLTLDLLAREVLPTGYRARLAENLRFALTALDEAARGGYAEPPPRRAVAPESPTRLTAGEIMARAREMYPMIMQRLHEREGLSASDEHLLACFRRENPGAADAAT